MRLDQATAIAALLAESNQATEAAMAVVLGPVPAWVPGPITDAARRVAGSLLADDAKPLAVRRQIDDILAGNDSLLVTAALPLGYIRRVYELAGFVYGASLGKVAGLRALAGEQAEIGQRFREGRKVGTVGPIKKAISKLLAKDPNMKTPELWKAISNKPPKGWQAFESARLGKYLEGPGVQNVGYRRFSNICSEERKKE